MFYKDKRFNKSILFALIFLLTFVFILGIGNDAFASKNPNEIFKKTRDLHVHFIDVGQGDSIFIELPNGKNALIDAGTDKAGDTVVNYIKSTKNNKIDYLIATHPHADHIGGMPKIISNFEIGDIYLPRKSHTTKTFENFLLSIQNKGLKAKEINSETVLFDVPGLAFKSFTPFTVKTDNLNNVSPIMKLHFGEHNFLFTGDAEIEVEEQLLDTDRNLSVDVLKVGHHGSNTSSSDRFLKATKAKYGVISVAKNNSYEHPNKQVLDRLRNNNVEVLRTDEDGTLVFKSDGKNLIVKKNGVIINKNEEKIKNTVVKPNSKPKSTLNSIKKPVTDNIKEVFITNTGSRYHKSHCRYVKKSKIPSSLENAKLMGLKPCKICKP